MKVMVETSARHVHVTKEDLEKFDEIIDILIYNIF